MIIKNILVTGGAGYIGSKIAYDLLKSSYNVFILDNFSTGYKFLIPKKAEYIKGDILDSGIVENIFKKKRIDSVMHLAASLSVEESEKNPFKYYKNNVLGIENLLKIASRYKIKSFILSSTCAVYGNSRNGRVNESSNLLPESNYGRTKMISEIILKNYAKIFKFNYGILRYFNVIGADKELLTGSVKSPTLFKILAKNIVNKKLYINVFGKNYATKDGTCIRDFIDVNDLSELHILTLNKIKKKKSLLLNCGYGDPLSVMEIIQAFSKVIKKKIIINFKAKRVGDVEKIYCDNKKLHKIFKNWKRKFSIAKSIINQIAWEKKLKNYAKLK